MHAEENVLKTLNLAWEKVRLQTAWVLECCTKPLEETTLVETTSTSGSPEKQAAVTNTNPNSTATTNINSDDSTDDPAQTSIVQRTSFIKQLTLTTPQ